MYLTAVDMLWTMEFDVTNWQTDLNKCIEAVVWTIRAIISTMSSYSCGQLVFNRVPYGAVMLYTFFFI